MTLHVNLNSHIELVATIMDSTDLGGPVLGSPVLLRIHLILLRGVEGEKKRET